MRYVAAALVLCAACGGTSGPPSPTPFPQLDPGFSGRWTGTTTVAIEGNPTNTFTGQIGVSVSFDHALVTQICPDGSGSVVAVGIGVHAQWESATPVTCPPVVFTNCAAVTFTYVSGILDLTGPNNLTAVGLGRASGCGVTLRLTTTLVGTRT